MSTNTIYLVDVFAEEKYAGNQLAVVIVSDSLSEIEMQKIAREVNFSETAFILSDETRDGGYDVRIFTPQEEVPFAGHPTLGTAQVIQNEIIKEPVEEVKLNLKIGQIPVVTDVSTAILWMKQVQPIFGMTLEPKLISQVLNIDVQEIDDKSPVQEVSTGLPFIIVPLKTLEILKQCRINRDRYFKLLKDNQAKALLLFSPETYHEEDDLCVRVFADYYGVPEDPATGSANGSLAAYLVKYRYFGENKIDIRVEQGYEIGRPSLIFLRSEEKEKKIDVYVGGRVILVAKGELT